MLTKAFKQKALERLDKMSAADFRKAFKKIGSIEITDMNSAKINITKNKYDSIIDDEMSFNSQMLHEFIISDFTNDDLLIAA